MRSLFSRGLSVPVRPCLPVAFGRGVGLRPREAPGRWGWGAALSVRQGRIEEGEGNTGGVEGRGQPSPSPQDAALPSAPSTRGLCLVSRGNATMSFLS